jgi:hypothetical protein
MFPTLLSEISDFYNYFSALYPSGWWWKRAVARAPLVRRIPVIRAPAPCCHSKGYCWRNPRKKTEQEKRKTKREVIC